MTLDKAIETGRLIVDTPPSGANQDFVDAIKLLIAAGKEVKRARNGNPAMDGELLPGETEE